MLRIPRGQRRSDETTLRPHAVVLFLFGSCTRNQRSRLVRCARPTTARTLWPRRRHGRRAASLLSGASTRFSVRARALQCKSVLADGRWMAARRPEPCLSTSVRALLRANSMYILVQYSAYKPRSICMYMYCAASTRAPPGLIKVLVDVLQRLYCYLHRRTYSCQSRSCCAAVLLLQCPDLAGVARWTARWGSLHALPALCLPPPNRLTSANSRPREIGRLGACSTPGSPLT